MDWPITLALTFHGYFDLKKITFKHNLSKQYV